MTMLALIFLGLYAAASLYSLYRSWFRPRL
ncbi:hypothetical protein HDIA_0158 [Hartmannibacter diazotrophicus]|uniref:Uncharacterized protein n=1 Tax=Hartmannibacter diazotrophicus TaxID=1482074 RepID=A0A2C9D0H8_9HYPH|nr:hypothetical protein HDIA_0158 [Hartmannibacter diazotrophicus]